jgi:hypothetical protein
VEAQRPERSPSSSCTGFRNATLNKIDPPPPPLPSVAEAAAAPAGWLFGLAAALTAAVLWKAVSILGGDGAPPSDGSRSAGF